jgi:hypothetical protein
MQYMLLIYTDDAEQELDEAGLRAVYQGTSGWVTTSVRSRSSSRPRARVRVHGHVGEGTRRDTLVTDGPFAETKETLGGYYLIEADSLDEAIEWAARIPLGPQRHGRDPTCARQLGVPRIDELDRAYRDERARCIAILGRVLGDLDLAEDAVQTHSSSRPNAGHATGRLRTRGHGSSQRRATGRSTGYAVSRRSPARPSCSRGPSSCPTTRTQ